MKALILSGGKGTRLRPITFSMAKQLVPIANKPVLFYGLDAVAQAGIKEVGIIVGETHEAIETSVGDGSKWGVKVTFIPQEEPLGLAHAVKIAQPFLQDEPFIMYLGDNIIKTGVKDLVAEFNVEKPDATILLSQVPNPNQFGVAELREGRVISLEEKPAVPKSNFALVGVYLFNSSIFEAVNTIKPSGRGELEITDAIQYLIDKGKNIHSHIIKGWWKDTGDLDAMLEANRLVLEDLETKMDGEIDAKSSVGGRVSISAGSKLINCIVRGPVIIGENCELNNCYIGPFSAVGDNSKIVNSELEYSVVLSNSTIENIQDRIEYSLLGSGVIIRQRASRPRTVRLLVGDNSVVELP